MKQYKSTVLHSTLSDSESATEAFAASFAASLPTGTFVALGGDLGAGKTAFVRGMARHCVPSAFVCSPTYALVNEYIDEGCALIHFDMYRIHDEESLYMTGFYDYFDRNAQKKCIYAVEWYENIDFALPNEYYQVNIEKLDGTNRRITVFHNTRSVQ